MIENVICRVVKVDCIPNDPVDIKFGGPKYLGVDVYVKKSDVKFMMDYIRYMFYEYGIPFINIRDAHAKIVNNCDIVDEKTIKDYIETHREELINGDFPHGQNKTLKR